MKRVLAITVLLSGIVALGVAQQARDDAARIGADTAQQRLQEVSISKFEDAGFWRVHMPIDQGIIESRRFEGGPDRNRSDWNPIPEEEALGVDTRGDYVLGVKAQFFRRSDLEISVQPIRPLQVPGITKTISVWVVGRNLNHRLNVVVADYFGNVNVLYMGRLNFSGWRQVTVAVPPTIVQKDKHYVDRMGLQILGFMIQPEMLEAYGSYYVYFDDLRVFTDLFAEESRDPDDMIDWW